MVVNTLIKSNKLSLIIAVTFVLLSTTGAYADNFCSNGHGSGGGGLVEQPDGSLALPITHKPTAIPKAHTMPYIAVAGLQQNKPAQLQQSLRIKNST